jgi:hypothetical protein
VKQFSNFSIADFRPARVNIYFLVLFGNVGVVTLIRNTKIQHLIGYFIFDMKHCIVVIGFHRFATFHSVSLSAFDSITI